MSVFCITDEIVELQLRKAGRLAPLLVRAIADDLRTERIRRAQLEQATANPRPASGSGSRLGARRANRVPPARAAEVHDPARP